MTISYSQVIQAIRAVDKEAARRGQMFPKTAEEQAQDREAADRICEMIRWYGEHGAQLLSDWPRQFDLDDVTQERDALREALALATRAVELTSQLALINKQEPTL